MPGPKGHDYVNELDAREWMRCSRCGDWEGAWAASDRIRSRGPGSTVWDGASLAGRRVVVRCNHGLGDTIQFIRFAPMLRGVARHVTVCAHRELLPLLQTVEGIDRLCDREANDPGGADAQIEVMELAYIFRCTTHTVPRAVPYVSAPVVRFSGGRPHVGIVWRSGPWDARRSIEFEMLAPLFALPTVSWHALQHEIFAHERHDAVHRADTREILRTAGAMRGLDLVISIDSMPAHLAGALGVPVWTLLQRHADWRWMEQRADSPWYPTMRLFRQPTAGDWRPVVDDVRRGLQTLCGLSSPAHQRREVRRLAVHQQPDLEHL